MKQLSFCRDTIFAACLGRFDRHLDDFGQEMGLSVGEPLDLLASVDPIIVRSPSAVTMSSETAWSTVIGPRPLCSAITEWIRRHCCGSSSRACSVPLGSQYAGRYHRYGRTC